MSKKESILVLRLINPQMKNKSSISLSKSRAESRNSLRTKQNSQRNPHTSSNSASEKATTENNRKKAFSKSWRTFVWTETKVAPSLKPKSETSINNANPILSSGHSTLKPSIPPINQLSALHLVTRQPFLDMNSCKNAIQIFEKASSSSWAPTKKKPARSTILKF